MLQSAIDTSKAAQVSELYLDYGADAQTCEPGQLEVCDRGMCFRSSWQFEVGTVIAVVCVRSEAGAAPEQLRVEGVVARCEPECIDGKRTFTTMLAFLGLPEETKRMLREFSAHVAAIAD